MIKFKEIGVEVVANGLKVIIFIFLISLETFASEILEVSSSKKSFILSLGRIEGLIEGDEAIFMRNEGVEIPDPKPVAFAEAIKVYPNYSVWFLKEMGKSEYLVKGSNLQVIIKRDTLKGRVPLRVKKVKVYTNKENAMTGTDNELNRGVPEELVVKENLYAKGNSLRDQDGSVWNDRELYELHQFYLKNAPYLEDGWNSETGALDYNADAYIVDMTKLRDKESSAEFKSLAVGVQQKIAKEKFGLPGLYKNPERDPDYKQLYKSITDQTLYRKFEEAKSAEQLVMPAASKRVQSGPDWSKDMSDQELRDFVVSSGIAREQMRQRFALQHRVDHEILLRYGVGTAPTTNPDDPNNQHSNRIFMLGYELHLLAISESLSRFSSEFYWGMARNHFDSKVGYNVQTDESFVGTALNFYLLANPNIIASPMLFVGMGLRFGEAKIDSVAADSSRDYLYDVQSIPYFQIGAKYRFRGGDEHTEVIRVGMALNALLTFERTSYGLKEEALSNDNINVKMDLVDTKFVLGTSIYF